MSTRRWAALFGLVGAVPTVVWAVHGSGFIFDDWTYAGTVRFQGAWHLFATGATRNPGRPVQAAYFALTYGVFGAHPAAHALALAVLNGAAGALVFVVGDRIWDRRLAIAAALAWVALPNRGSTRLWLATAPAVLALCLLLVAVLLLTDDRWWASAWVLTVAVLTYESILAAGVFALLFWAWRSAAGSWRRACAALLPVVAATAYIVFHSPKQARSPDPVRELTTLIAADFGRGIFGSPLAARLAEATLLLVLAVAAYGALAPGRARSSRGTTALAGLGLVALGAAPFLVTRFPFSTDGIFDRGNLVPDLGVALLLGAVVCMGLDHLPRTVAVALTVGVIGVPAFLNGQDLHDYQRAVSEGTLLERHLAADVRSPTTGVLVGPPLSTNGGVAQFLSSDIGSALDLERGTAGSRAHMACSAEQFANPVEPVRYDRVTRTVTRRQGPPPPNATPSRTCQ